jgi:transcriptional regulator with XRE-family HTH domain
MRGLEGSMAGPGNAAIAESQNSVATADLELDRDEAFGPHVKALRREHGWTLEQLGAKAGLSISALSKIENAQVSASFDTRVKIAHAFGQSFGQLHRLPENQPLATARRTFTRAGRGLKFHTSSYDYDVHSADLVAKGMIPLVMRIKAREVMPIAEWSSHDGEEFIYVTAGEVDLHTEFYAPLRLGVGDSAYIDSTMRHAFVSIADDDAEILSICMTERLAFAEGTIGRGPQRSGP